MQTSRRIRIVLILLGLLLLLWDTPPAPARSGTSPLLWGAWIDGSTYGRGWCDSPYDLVAQSGCTQPTTALFEAHVAKRVSIIHFGTAYKRNGMEQGFPAEALDAIRAHGATALLDWAVWDSSAGAEQPDFTSAKVASGLYDPYITTWARAAKAYGNPLLLRFAWEMNSEVPFPWSESRPNPNGNASGDYVKMWRHVHDIFRREGAGNVAWVWCPNIQAMDAHHPPLASVYPGSAYVDWTCLDAYNQYSQWLALYQLLRGRAAHVPWLADSYGEVLALAPDKPLLLGEIGSNEDPANPQRKAAWIRDALTTLATRLPRVRAIVWFNWNLSQKEQWAIETSAAAQAAFAESVASVDYATNTVTDTPTPSPTATPLPTATLMPFPATLADGCRWQLVFHGLTFAVECIL